MQQSNATKPKSLNWAAPSNLTVFIRNLKLLQLDQREDWPPITSRTLSPSQQNQRQRVKAVEWALYQLFAIWDPQGTQAKLRPFFPPLEPLQSVNLRAALFRALSDLKKNGDLGRETMLRKTMLDDCKGEKFDEILAVFSTVVLRKVLAATADVPLNPAIQISTAKGITVEDHQIVLPLILAHQASLGAMWDRRARVRSTYTKFAELLDKKKIELTARSEEKPSSIPDEPADIDSISREVRANWLGGEEWANTLLYGGSRSSTDGFLELPFSKAWARANESTVEELSNAPVKDLLVDLESRISQQRNRLRKWREFSDSIHQKAGLRPLSQVNSAKDSPLLFRDHQSLNVASISKAVREPVNRKVLHDDDQFLLMSMDKALARIDGKSHSPFGLHVPAFKNAHVPTKTVVEHKETSPISIPAQPGPLPRVTADDEPQAAPSPQAEDNRSKSPAINISMEESPESTSENSDADSVASGIRNPEYHRSSNPLTLVERTRKSMSLLPPPSERPRERYRSTTKPRPSFPVNQFETPRKQSQHHAPISRASTPRDELFEEDAEYASVFKSRPKVALSPIASPAVHVAPLDVEFDVDEPGSPWDGNAGHGGFDINSPLANARVRR